MSVVPACPDNEAAKHASNGVLVEWWTHAELRRGRVAESVKKRCVTMRAFGRWLYPSHFFDADHRAVDHWLDSRRLGSLRTRNWHRANLASFYRWCVREEFTDHNPTDRVDRATTRTLLPRPIANDDLATALRLAAPRMSVWLSLAAYEGLRCKEIAGLRREDVMDRFSEPMLLVSAPKGHRERVLPLNAKVEQALAAWGMPSRGFLFPPTRGTPHGCPTGHVSARAVSVQVSKFLRELDIDATAHMLRHWFGTEMYRLTHDLALVQDLMGHASPTTTRIYVAFSPGVAVPLVRGLSV